GWGVVVWGADLAGNGAGGVGEPVAGNGARSADGGSADPAGGLAAELARWDRAGRRLDELAAGGDLRLGPMLMDAFTHELDLCAALGVAAPADHPAYPPAFDVVVSGLAWSIGSRGLPALQLACEAGSWVARPRPVAGTLTASRYDLYRSLTGRRTPAQIAALEGRGGPSRWLPAVAWGPSRLPGRPAEPTGTG